MLNIKKKQLIKEKTGTNEWVKLTHKINTCKGCFNNCRYCYSRFFANHYGWKAKDKNGKTIQVKNYENWSEMYPEYNKIEKNYRKRDGIQMYASSHDFITIDDKKIPLEDKKRISRCFHGCMKVLKKLYDSDNEILIVSKLRKKVLQYIYTRFNSLKNINNTEIRATITTYDDIIKKYFEPNAPFFRESFESLLIAFFLGYKTSVNIEPCLMENPFNLIQMIYPYANEIWLGIMSKIPRSFISKEANNYIDKIYSINNLMSWYEMFKNDEKVKFKHTLRKKLEQNGIIFNKTI